MALREIRCRGCGRPIDRSLPNCPWCRTPRPNLFARITDWSSGEGRGHGVVNAIIAANVALYIISLLMSRGGGHGMHSFNPLGFLSPGDTSLLMLGATGSVPVFELGRYWTLITASYLHGGLLHIFFNMLALRQIGPWVCTEFGSGRMFVIYTVSGIIGYLASCFAGVGFTIGASASVCGLIGALYYFGKSRGGNYGAAVSREVSGWLISLVLFGLVMPGINNWGHGGGVVGGALLGMLLGYQERRPERTVHRLLALICLLATVLALVPAAFTASSLLM